MKNLSKTKISSTMILSFLNIDVIMAMASDNIWV